MQSSLSFPLPLLVLRASYHSCLCLCYCAVCVQNDRLDIKCLPAFEEVSKAGENGEVSAATFVWDGGYLPPCIPCIASLCALLFLVLVAALVMGCWSVPKLATGAPAALITKCKLW
jgi:hypothetical protein